VPLPKILTRPDKLGFDLHKERLKTSTKADSVSLIGSPISIFAIDFPGLYLILLPHIAGIDHAMVFQKL
jgi:hypothetical protein